MTCDAVEFIDQHPSVELRNKFTAHDWLDGGDFGSRPALLDVDYVANQIEKLLADPRANYKLALNFREEFVSYWAMAEEELWPSGENNRRTPWKDVCIGDDVPIYNGNDYLVESSGWCSAYINQKVCCIEDKLKKVYKMLKKGGKRTSKYSRGY